MRWSDEVSVPVQNVKLHSDKPESFVSKQNQIVLHKIVILDGSGSMQGEKYDAAEQGVKLDYESCKAEFKDYLLVEFSNRHTVNLYDFSKPLKFKPSYGGTALYDTIVSVFSDVLTNTPSEDKVLVQIFTDGEDLHSLNSPRTAKGWIEKFNDKGWTVTFVGTEKDVKFIQNQLSIDSTNTLVHDNTAQGVAETFTVYRSATRSFTKNVAQGKETTKGFFKDINNG